MSVKHADIPESSNIRAKMLSSVLFEKINETDTKMTEISYANMGGWIPN